MQIYKSNDIYNSGDKTLDHTAGASAAQVGWGDMKREDKKAGRKR